MGVYLDTDDPKAWLEQNGRALDQPPDTWDYDGPTLPVCLIASDSPPVAAVCYRQKVLAGFRARAENDAAAARAEKPPREPSVVHAWYAVLLDRLEGALDRPLPGQSASPAAGG